MRVVGEIPHPECKITIFNWNGKYLVKFEQRFLEQTYKINELDLTEEDDLKVLTQSPFVEKVLLRFKEMQKDLFEAMEDFY